MTPDPIATVDAIVNYGFAGFAAVLLVMVFWMVNKIMDVFERNTAAFTRLTAMLSTRPCLKDDRELMEHGNGKQR